MKGLLFLLCCIKILGVLLCGADALQASPTPDPINAPDPNSSKILRIQNNVSVPTSTAVLPTTSVSTSTLDKLMSSQSAKTISHDSKSPPSTPQPGSKPNTLIDMFFKEECLSLLMVTSGLFVACTLLLLATLLLACKVCRLSRRIKALSSNSDTISSSEYWMGKKDKSKPEEEPRETTVLMADVNQTQEEVGNGAAKEGGEKVNADEQTEEEEKRTEEEGTEEKGDAAKTEEASAAPVAAAENSSPPKQQEEATDSQPDGAAAASASEGTEEAKDVV